MASIINASPTNGIVQTADGSGVLKCQANGVTTNALAWVNFNGTGTVAIRSSYNVSSITDGGTGVYTVNLTTALADSNCAPVACGMRYAASVSRAGSVFANMSSTSAVRVFTGYEDTLTGPVPTDLEFVQIAIFGN